MRGIIGSDEQNVLLDKVLNTVICGDSIKTLKKIPSNSIDVIFADPPYYMQLGGELLRPDNSLVDAVDDDWDKFSDFKSYDEFTLSWMSEAHRVLKDNGTLWVIGSYHNIFRVGTVLQNIGFWVLNDIIWRKNNPMPNFKGTRFTNAHETLIWCAKNKNAKYTFNYDAMKALNEGLQMRSDWCLPICSGGERLKDEKGDKVHSTQKPESLLYRVLLASTKPGDVILDPFFGSGTTGAVAKKMGRNFIGIEREEKYIKAAQKRIAEIEAVRDITALTLEEKKAQIRIPFGSVLEHGFLNPGDILFDARKRASAKILADGNLMAENGARGSIHQVGAILQRAPSCNGWTFWHFENKKDLVCIDLLRQRIRSELEIAA